LIVCGTNQSLLCWNSREVLPETKKIKYLYGRSVDSTEDMLVKVTGLVYSPSGESIATSGSDGLLRIFDASTGELVWYHQPFDDDIEVCSVAIDAKNKRIVCGSEDGKLAHWAWNESTRERVQSTAVLFPAHDEAVICMAFSRDGRVLCTGSWDCTCIVWSAQKMFQEKRQISVVDDRSFPLVCTIANFHGWVKSVDVSGGVRGGRLVVGVDDGAVHSYSFDSLFDVEGVVRCVVGSSEDGEEKGNIEAPTRRSECGEPLYCHAGAVNCVRYGMAGDLIASCSDDSTINVYSTLGRTLRYTIDEECGRDAVSAVDWGGPDASILYVGSADCSVRIFNGKNRDLLCTLGGHEDEVTMVTSTPETNGPQFVTGSADGTMRFWSIELSSLQ
jgi:WD40 repeat protein